ncbi:MAG: glycine zipper family protein [Elusimicrobia bacterium]|nr:glycine zipper family protein [Elusimicrobiota bacterium]
MDRRLFAALMLAAALCAGCASPQVKLYPDEHYKSLPKEAVQKDIDDCEAKAKEFVKSHKGQMVAKRTGAGAVFGAVLGVIVGAFTGDYGSAIGQGAAMGAATGLASGAIEANSPEGVHRRFVEYCLADKGYRPMGWK